MLAFIISLLAGLFVSGVALEHRRVTTLLGAGLTIGWGWWLCLTFISRTWLQTVSVDGVYVLGGLLLAVLFLPWARRWKLPYKNGAGSGWRDVAVLGVLLPTAVAALLIWRVNGQQGTDWVWHGFFNGDTATFASLVEKSFYATGLVTDNPFASGVTLEYPSLVHAGVAALFSAAGAQGWIHFLPTLTYVGIFATVAALFLLFDTTMPGAAQPNWLGLKQRWIIILPAAGVFYVMALGWDNFVYPQSHFFLFALCLVVAALFWRTVKMDSSLCMATGFLGTLLTSVLIASNAVVGTAALAVAGSAMAAIVLEKKNLIRLRVLALVMIVVFLALFFYLAPGEPQFGGLTFSYEAALDMTKLLPVLAIVIVGLAVSDYKPGAVMLSVAGLCLMAGVTFFFSNRDIIVANASRFLYHAVLLGWPFAITPLVRVGFWVRRQFMYTSHALLDYISGSILLITMAVLLLLPALAAVASAHDNLMRKDRQQVSSAMVEAMWWIEDFTTPQSVFVASPLPSWTIPFMTGRTLLRAGYEDEAYWLSSDDDVLKNIRAAFGGDKEAQAQVAAMADYLLVTDEERVLWEPVSFKKVFDNNAVVIYRLR